MLITRCKIPKGRVALTPGLFIFKMPETKKVESKKEENKKADVKAKTKKEEKEVEKKEKKKEAGKTEEKKKEEIKPKLIISKKALEEKAKKLEKKIKTTGDEATLKEQLKKSVKKKETLIPLEDYVKYGCYIGTKVIVPHMRPYVYKRRADGIAIINTNFIDKKIKEMIEYLSGFDPKDFIVICKREAGWKVAELFGELTGVRVFTKKYPAGIITNTALPNFLET